MFNYYKINGLIADKKRQNKKITIANMATDMGIALDALNKTKAGKSMPGADTLEKIALYFEVDINYFFDTFTPSEYKKNEPKALLLNDSKQAGYIKSDRNPWELLYEVQNELLESREECMEVKLENERLKNMCAHDKAAHAG
jgi:transcriptional regulator with XRE-family HTH domain